MSAFLRFLDPGPLTTVQDLGRPGLHSVGIPSCGAMDATSLQAANLLVGNRPEAGCLECAGAGPSFIVEAEAARVAFSGAEASIVVSRQDQSIAGGTSPTGRSLFLQRGDVVRVGAFKGSFLLYMAAEGGFDVAPVLGSVSTYVRGAFGGFEGRPLAAEDRLPLKRESVTRRGEFSLPLAAPEDNLKIRVLEGQQFDHFLPDAAEAFFSREYFVGLQRNRMGMRLEGLPLHHARGFNIASDGIARGSIQIPGDGAPLVLLNEHQTTGGYPKIATVVSADLHRLARAAVGAKLSFVKVSLEEAAASRRELTAALKGLPAQLTPVAEPDGLRPELLLEANLISGAVDALVA